MNLIKTINQIALTIAGRLNTLLDTEETIADCISLRVLGLLDTKIDEVLDAKLSEQLVQLDTMKLISQKDMLTRKTELDTAVQQKILETQHRLKTFEEDLRVRVKSDESASVILCAYELVGGLTMPMNIKEAQLAEAIHMHSRATTEVPKEDIN